MARDRHLVTLCGNEQITTATVYIERRSSGILRESSFNMRRGGGNEDIETRSLKFW